MAHNPILNAYLIELNPVNKDEATFRHFCKAKFFSDKDNLTDKQLALSLYENFLKALGGEKLINDKKSKKVLGIQETNGTNQSIKSHFSSSLIEGIIDGGKYGISRQVTDIDNNKNREALGSKKAILDQYYFYLYTPLNSNRGILLIQSYTEETIQQPFKDFLQVFFSHENHFYNLIYDNWVPQRVAKEFAETAELSMFSYRTIIGVGNQLKKQIDTSIKGFEVIIQIKPLSERGKVSPKEKNLNGIVKGLGTKKFDKTQLSDMGSPMVHIKNDKRNAHFSIVDQISNIKPTIYLKNEGVEVDDETGIPNFSQMKGVCEKVLNEIIPEIAKKLEIDEF